MSGKFPGAPFYATFTPEGWMVLEDECWKAEEWALLTPMQRRRITGDVPLLDETPKQVELRRKRWRDRVRRARQAA